MMAKLTTKESLALQAMIRRAGWAAVLDELQMLAGERDGDEWQRLAGALNGLLQLAHELPDSEEA